MSKKTDSKTEADKTVRNIQRQTRRKFNAEEKIRIVLAGLRGEESIAELCRKEDVWLGRGEAILQRRQKLKLNTLRQRKILHMQQRAA